MITHKHQRTATTAAANTAAAAPDQALRIRHIVIPATLGAHRLKYPGGRFVGVHYEPSSFHAYFLADPRSTGDCTFTVADLSVAVAADAGGFLGSAIMGGRRVFVFGTCVS